MVSEQGFTSKLNRREEKMSTRGEMCLELLSLDGSNYASWSTHVHKMLRAMGPQFERIVDVSICPPTLDWTNLSNLEEERKCLQINAQATNFLLSLLSEDLQDIILKMRDIREDAHLVWTILSELFDESKCDDYEKSLE